MKRALLGTFGLAVLALVSATAAHAAGWVTTTDPRGRAFLSYTDAESGEKFLTIRCLRDVDVIGAAVEGLGLPKKANRLTLSSDGGTFTIKGAIERDGKKTNFEGETAATEKSLSNLQRAVVDVLAGDGDVAIKVGDKPVAEIPPVGDVKSLRKFLSVCFKP